MGREVRRVPPHWEHPKEDKLNYRTGGTEPQFVSMHDEHWSDALNDWLEKFDEVRDKGISDVDADFYPRGLADWLADSPPPNPKHYLPYRKEEATWFQLYETVSEGTPVTPPFATKEELVDYLVAEGDFWGQKRAKDPLSMEYRQPPQWSRQAAEQMLNDEWAPTMMVVTGGPQAGIYTPQTGQPGLAAAATDTPA